MKKTFFIIAHATCVIAACTMINPKQKCTPETMLLTSADFPSNTIVNETRSPIADMPEESAGFTANYNGSAIYEEISRFPKTSMAESEFTKAVRRASGETENNSTWHTPLELSHISSTFKEYYVACAENNHEYQCRMIGQKDGYYVFLFAYISDNGISLEMFNELLQSVDDRIVICLNN